jgi:hypothetical protein
MAAKRMVEPEGDGWMILVIAIVVVCLMAGGG